MSELQISVEEHRAAQRVRSLLRAMISYHNGSFQLDVMIRDLSPTGARLAVNADVTLPEIFELTIPKTGTKKRARIVWRRPTEIGVRFDGEAMPEPEPTSDIDELRARIKQLEFENRQLKLRVEQLTQG